MSTFWPLQRICLKIRLGYGKVYPNHYQCFQHWDMVIHAFVSSHLDYCNSIYCNSIHDRCPYLITVQSKTLQQDSSLGPCIALISPQFWCHVTAFRLKSGSKSRSSSSFSRLWIILLQSRSVIYLHRVPLLGPSGPLNTACCILIKNENTKGLCIRCPGSRLWDGLPLGISLSGLLNLSRRPFFSECCCTWVL